jgi:hypothetical protein
MEYKEISYYEKNKIKKKKILIFFVFKIKISSNI